MQNSAFFHYVLAMPFYETNRLGQARLAVRGIVPAGYLVWLVEPSPELVASFLAVGICTRTRCPCDKSEATFAEESVDQSFQPWSFLLYMTPA
jgi:hypothetical protein